MKRQNSTTPTAVPSSVPVPPPRFGFCFRPALDRNDCSGPLLLWIDTGGKTIFMPTTYDVRREEWDPVSGSILIPRNLTNPIRNRRLSVYKKSMARDLQTLETTLGKT